MIQRTRIKRPRAIVKFFSMKPSQTKGFMGTDLRLSVWTAKTLFSSAKLALRAFESGTTEFLTRFLRPTSNRSRTASTREQFSPALKVSTGEQFSLAIELIQQTPTNPDANVCQRGEAMNHTSRRSAETRLRVVRDPQPLFSGTGSDIGNAESFSRRERTNQNEENNASQCIANRGMSDCDHRRRAA